VGFALSSSGHAGKVIAPEDVGTQVLKYLMGITADFLGHDQVRSMQLLLRYDVEVYVCE
jgi:hypothetical protein